MWTEPKDAQCGQSPRTHTVWTAPLGVCRVEGAPRCPQCERSPRTHTVWMASLDVHGVDSGPEGERGGQ